MWGDNFADIQPAPLTRPCAACGRAERYLDCFDLCEPCRAEYDAEAAMFDALDRTDEDAAARRRYYSG